MEPIRLSRDFFSRSLRFRLFPFRPIWKSRHSNGNTHTGWAKPAANWARPITLEQVKRLLLEELGRCLSVTDIPGSIWKC